MISIPLGTKDEDVGAQAPASRLRRRGGNCQPEEPSVAQNGSAFGAVTVAIDAIAEQRPNRTQGIKSGRTVGVHVKASHLDKMRMNSFQKGHTCNTHRDGVASMPKHGDRCSLESHH